MRPIIPRSPIFRNIRSQQLKDTPLASGKSLQAVIQEALEGMLERRARDRNVVATGSGETVTADHRICTAHDLAPVFEEAFRI